MFCLRGLATMKLLTAPVRSMNANKLLLCSVVLLAACGQKGPLYFPEETPPPSEPFSACDAPDAPCRQEGTPDATPTQQSLPESSTVPGAFSTEPIDP